MLRGTAGGMGRCLAALCSGCMVMLLVCAGRADDQTAVAGFDAGVAARHWSGGYRSPGTNLVSCEFSYPTNRTLLFSEDDLVGTVVTWLWDTNYWLNLEAEGHGSVSPTDMWVRAGSPVVATADPDAGYAFDGWSGSGTNHIIGGGVHTRVVTVRVVEPIDLTAAFVLGVAAFRLTSLSESDGTVTLRWQDTDIWSTVQWTTDLTAPTWRTVDDGTSWPIRGGLWSGAAPTDHPHVFFRVLAE